MPATLTVSHVRERISGAIYLGRGVARVGLATSAWAYRARTGHLSDQAELVWSYHNLILGDGALRASLSELRGKTVACWCRRSDEVRTPANVCHADVIAVWLEYFSDATLRWLGRHDLAQGWADELDDRVQALLEE